MKKGYQITPERRAEILAQEVLGVDNICELWGCSTSKAYEIIAEIKRRHDRVKVSGVVHIQDYIDFFELPPDRYVIPKQRRTYEIDYEKIEEDNVLNVLSKVLSRLSDEQLGYVVSQRQRNIND